MTTVHVTIQETGDLLSVSEKLNQLSVDWEVFTFELYRPDAAADESEWTLDVILQFTADRGPEGVARVTTDLAALVSEQWNITYIDNQTDPEDDGKEQGDGIKQNPEINIDPDKLWKLIDNPQAFFKEQTIDLSQGPVKLNVPGVGWGVVGTDYRMGQ